MIRTGKQYRDSIRDGRRVWINGERVTDVTTHPMFKPLVDIRARIYDMQHEAAHRPVLTYRDASGEEHAIGLKLPMSHEDWPAKRRATDAVLDEIGGVVTRVGDESPPFAHLAAVYRSFDWNEALGFVRKSAGLSERVMGKK
jgi:4-hydroxyphenylacetate 3-monooxygenase